MGKCEWIKECEKKELSVMNIRILETLSPRIIQSLLQILIIKTYNTFCMY